MQSPYDDWNAVQREKLRRSFNAAIQEESGLPQAYAYLGICAFLFSFHILLKIFHVNFGCQPHVPICLSDNSHTTLRSVIFSDLPILLYVIWMCVCRNVAHYFVKSVKITEILNRYRLDYFDKNVSVYFKIFIKLLNALISLFFTRATYFHNFTYIAPPLECRPQLQPNAPSFLA